MYTIAEALKNFIDVDRDTIWAFILKNIYKPLFFKRKFDFIVGNPPWIAFRFMDPAYQVFLKRQITQEYKLLRGRGELITHLEVGTLFFVRAGDLYLKPGGAIAFVLPKSVFSADQHDGLRRRSFKFSEDSDHTLFWHEVWDFESVEPLFRWPACVVVADKRLGKEDPQSSEFPGKVLAGKLARKNALLSEADQVLTEEEVQFALHTRGKHSFWATGKGTGTREQSYYKRRFAQGATILPRSFWFVRLKASPVGFDPNLPPLESILTSKAGPVKVYKDVKIEGNVESRFIYATVLGDDVLPFGLRKIHPIVLPIEPDGEHCRLIDAKEAREHGFVHLAKWVDSVEAEWARLRRSKAERITALGWLDYRGKLTSQNPQAKYLVVYPNFQRVSVAAAVPREQVFADDGLRFEGLAVDHALYYCEADDPREAYYLCACLNSPSIDKRLGALRRKAQKMRPNVHKKIFDVAPLPKFDPTNASHRKLVDLGKTCGDKVASWLANGEVKKDQSLGSLRAVIRKKLDPELKELDALVEEILK